MTTGHTLTISGGWKGDCSASQVIDPNLTILEGFTLQDSQGGVLFVNIQDNEDPTTVDISNLTIQGGSSNLSGGGFYFEHNLTGTANVTTLNISNFIAQFNQTNTFGSGIAVYDWGTDGLNVNISDCLIKNN